MLIKFNTLKERLHGVILNKGEQGYEVKGLREKLENLPESFDSILSFIDEIDLLKIRSDWEYIEPNNIDEIKSSSDPTRSKTRLPNVNLNDASKKVEAAFLASLCGCILGKPLEASLTGQEIKNALEQSNQWPLKDYVSGSIKEFLPRVHPSHVETTKENITYVAPDDDINYTIMGMLILEKFGTEFTHENMEELWIHHLPINTTFGPERTRLLNVGLNSLDSVSRSNFLSKGGVGKSKNKENYKKRLDAINDYLNPGDELCGAAIRADAYGYALPGNPELSSELAARDAGFTHNRTGIYGTMFIAALISCSLVMEDKNEIISTALKYVPQKSRFFYRSKLCFEELKQANNWEDGYLRINKLLNEYGHCRIYQEIGMLMNSFIFANNTSEGICIQVSQGADTDSFGATSGSVLGSYYGPSGLDPKWLEPFNDDIHTGMAWFFERSVSNLASRMGQLPIKFSK